MSSAYPNRARFLDKLGMTIWGFAFAHTFMTLCPGRVKVELGLVFVLCYCPTERRSFTLIHTQRACPWGCGFTRTFVTWRMGSVSSGKSSAFRYPIGPRFLLRVEMTRASYRANGEAC